MKQIARQHDAIVGALQTNAVTTVWQRLDDQQGLQASDHSSHCSCSATGVIDHAYNKVGNYKTGAHLRA